MIETSLHPIFSGEMTWHEVQSIQGCQICSKCKKKSCTLVWFSTRSNLNIHSIPTCNVSKERKQILAQIYNLLFLSRGYTLRVIIKWIYLLYSYFFFAHCTVIVIGWPWQNYVKWLRDRHKHNKIESIQWSINTSGVMSKAKS